MLGNHLCDGRFSLNGIVLASTVGVGTQDSFLTAGVLERRHFLTLDFFTPRVFFLNDNETLVNGARYELKGPRVANLSHGPLGHPGDGEYDRWEFSEIALSFQFTRHTLSVTLDGVSEPGTSGSIREKKPLSTQSTHVAFVVHRRRMKEFLRMTDSGWSYFEKRLDSFPS